MRKFLLLTTLAAAGVIAAGISVQAQTYGPGMMENNQYNGHHRGHGSGYGMMGDGSGNMMGGSGYGPGMMDYGSDNDGDSREQGNRGNHRCWNETDSTRGHGYYAACSN